MFSSASLTGISTYMAPGQSGRIRSLPINKLLENERKDFGVIRILLVLDSHDFYIAIFQSQFWFILDSRKLIYN